jgi:predicted small lipoprotein YifL
MEKPLKTRKMLPLCGAMACLLLLSACGIKGELVRPSDIPAYEKAKEDRRGSLPL